MTPEKITILGGGSWGATLGSQLSLNGHRVSLWEFVPEVAKKLKEERILKTLPNFRLDKDVRVSNDMSEVLKEADIVFCVVPSHTVRATFASKAAQKYLNRGALVVIATKGIETDSDKRMSEIVRESCPNVGDIVILSGPSHAEEVSEGKPVVLVAASTSTAAAHRVRDMFNAEQFRVYVSDDPTGVELGGSLKNVYALACGIADGLSLGDNIKAALISRGLIEMTRLGVSLGAQTFTFFGLSGLGDLIVTSNSRHSRNRHLGELIGKGSTLREALAQMTMVAEGVNTTKSGYQLSQIHKIDTPIINEMYQVLFEDKSPNASLRDLMARNVRTEEMEGLVI